MKKKIRQNTWRTYFGIVNHLGDPWTPQTFCNRVTAENYLAGQQRQNPRWALGRHRVVPVSVTIRVIAAKKK